MLDLNTPACTLFIPSLHQSTLYFFNSFAAAIIISGAGCTEMSTSQMTALRPMSAQTRSETRRRARRPSEPPESCSWFNSLPTELVHRVYGMCDSAETLRALDAADK